MAIAGRNQENPAADETGSYRGYTGFEGHVAFDDLHPSDSQRVFIRGRVVINTNIFTHQPIMHSLALAGPQTSWGAGLKDYITLWGDKM